jgi:antitoxin component of MazEF toxin-antitoxin module
MASGKKQLRKLGNIYNQKTIYVTLPLDYTKQLGFNSGDYVKVTIEGKNKIAIEKIDL